MKPEWGTKHECPGCGAHFYDMRDPRTCCPKCKTPINDEAALIAKKGGLDDKPLPVKHDIIEELDVIKTADDIEEGEDDLIEDTDDLVGNDEADMSEIMEHIDEGITDKNR